MDFQCHENSRNIAFYGTIIDSFDVAAESGNIVVLSLMSDPTVRTQETIASYKYKWKTGVRHRTI